MDLETSLDCPYPDARVRALGNTLSPEVSTASDALFAPLHVTASRRTTAHRDLPYGDDARQRLDIHVPAGTSARAPVLLFVHGGGFVRGEKNAPGCFYYDNIADWAVARRMVAVNITYRLAPQHTWPAGAEDVAAALAWTGSHIQAYGGDPRRIFLMGHSAGAVHAAGCIARLEQNQGPVPTPAGCILLSGIYDLPQGPVNKAYFGEDTTAYDARSPLEGLLNAQVPLLAAVAECDPPPIQNQFTLLAAGHLARRGRLPALACAIGHNHYTIVHHLGTPDQRLGEVIASFIRSIP